MKGFTLVEMLVYMAVSAMISTSLISLAFTLADANARIRLDVYNEEIGLLVSRNVENAMRNHIEIDPALVVPDANIHDITKSKTGEISNTSFMIDNKIFSISVYEK